MCEKKCGPAPTLTHLNPYLSLYLACPLGPISTTPPEGCRMGPQDTWSYHGTMTAQQTYDVCNSICVSDMFFDVLQYTMFMRHRSPVHIVSAPDRDREWDGGAAVWAVRLSGLCGCPGSNRVVVR